MGGFPVGPNGPIGPSGQAGQTDRSGPGQPPKRYAPAMTTDELREKYLQFFVSKGCTRQPSDVLVPTWDRSVLFTPAGMNQFKDHFLGKTTLDFTRATTCQKCLRTGDIDNVGRTAFHHTFFEMLGNFSFGDYFKTEAITWAWEFLTDKKWLGLDADRLTVTVYKDDDEAAKIWHETIGLPTSRIRREDEDENFWPASAPSEGPDGVCGPCSEIYYALDTDDGRGNKEVEIWNLVFTQFNRIGDPPDNLHPLPSRNIDTGMGLERTASVLQGQSTNYHIDILKPIVLAAAEITGREYDAASDDGRRLRRITDHARAAVFSVHENVNPGANGAKYVIRRLIRRAVLDGHQMGMRDPFLNQLVPAVVEQMRGPYPELAETADRVARTIRGEEERFLGNLDVALHRIDSIFDDMDSSGKSLIDGAAAADLYTSAGVPPELLQQMGAERHFTFDWDGYAGAMDQHAIDSGAGQKELFETGPIESLKASLRRTEFLGYEALVCDAAVKGIVVPAEEDDEDQDGRLVSQMSAVGGDPIELSVVLDQTTFYAESGGQVADAGEIVGDDFRFTVTDCKKQGDLFIHIGHLASGTIADGAACQTRVDAKRRDAIRRAHSATHLLHHALQTNLGRHAQQQGSKVEPDALRFDFSHGETIQSDQLRTIRDMVLSHVDSPDEVDSRVVPLADAKTAGAMMLFGEKYPDPVRMISIGEYSRELCGGTHVSSTSEIEAFEITTETLVSAGTHRVAALTGPRAVAHRQQTIESVREACEKLDCPPAQLLDAARLLAADVRQLKKDLTAGRAASQSVATGTGTAYNGAAIEFPVADEMLRGVARLLNVAPPAVVERIGGLIEERDSTRRQIAKATAGGQVTAEDLIEGGTVIGDTLIVVAEAPGANPTVMRGWIDQIRKRTRGGSATLLATVSQGKVILVAGVSRDLVAAGLSAGAWVSEAAAVVGGGGGGRPDMAQAGGKSPSKLPQSLALAIDSMKRQVEALP